MFYLTYLSIATKPMAHDQLLFLLDQSRKRNLLHDITGMLLYKGGNFMQLLEGERQAVLQIYDTIRNDERHTGVMTMLTGETHERSFENWSMGFCDMDQTGDLPAYDDYFTSATSLISLKDDAQRAYKFIRLFNSARR